MDWNIQTFETLPSTQEKAHELDPIEGTVIRAYEQTHGKGRHGNSWEHQKGNLAFSFILKPQCALSDIGQYSILTSVALIETAKKFSDKALTLKWPNDLLIENQKAAGILLETENSAEKVEALIVGIGVNTQNAPENTSALNCDSDKFLNEFLKMFAVQYKTYKEHGFAQIRDAWLANTYPKGTALNIGAFETMDEHGNLVVRDGENALQTFASGDVYLKEDHYASGY